METEQTHPIGRPKGFVVTVREIEIAAGAGFLVPITGEIMRMPGLPPPPAAESIDIDEDGNISGFVLANSLIFAQNTAMRRGIIPILFLLAAFLIGGWITYRLFNKRGEERTTVESSVLLERVREVFKLVTVEGDFSEIYYEKSIREVTLYLPIPTYWNFSKEALLEVKGKVLVGYNMEQVSFTVDSTTRTITLSNMPEPEILAIDHAIIYRNLEESYFNNFTPEDYTQLNKNAKAVLRKKAEESDLLAKARADGNGMVEAIRFLAESVGWTLKVNPPQRTLPPHNTPKN